MRFVLNALFTGLHVCIEGMEGRQGVDCGALGRCRYMKSWIQQVMIGWCLKMDGRMYQSNRCALQLLCVVQYLKIMRQSPLKV